MELTPIYNEAAGGPTGDPMAAEGGGRPDQSGGGAAETAPSAERSASETSTQPNNTPLRIPEPPTIEEAEAEIAELEAGRPAPKASLDNKPPSKLIQIVHTDVERKRELRIAALSAYLEEARPGPQNTQKQEAAEAPEPAL